MLILSILLLGVTGFAVDMVCRLLRVDRELVALEIQLAQVQRQRELLAEILARYEEPLDMKTLRWVVAVNGLPLLTLN